MNYSGCAGDVILAFHTYVDIIPAYNYYQTHTDPVCPPSPVLLEQAEKGIAVRGQMGPHTHLMADPTPHRHFPLLYSHHTHSHTFITLHYIQSQRAYLLDVIRVSTSVCVSRKGCVRLQWRRRVNKPSATIARLSYLEQSIYQVQTPSCCQ